MVVTIQRADMYKFGVGYKLATISTESELNKPMCFQVNGTNTDDAIAIQPILPDLTGFNVRCKHVDFVTIRYAIHIFLLL